MSHKARKSGKKKETSKIQADASSEPQQSAWRAIAVPSYVSSILLWAAFCPLALGWLGWVAPIGWLLVIASPLPLRRSSYWILWLSGCLFWLLTLQGIRLAFWPLTFGWIALSLYLAIYIPLFVLVSRILFFHWRVPLALAAPTGWVGFELARGYVVTGFSANLLAHTQVQYPVVIQIADQFGGYGVSFIVMMVAVAILQSYQYWRDRSQQLSLWSPLVTGLLLLAALGYGVLRLQETERLASERQPLLRVALIQENAPSIFESDPERTRLAWLRYLDATKEAGRKFGNLDLVIWPESTFTGDVPWMKDETQNQTLPSELIEAEVSRDEFSVKLNEYTQLFDNKVTQVLSASRGERLPSSNDQAEPSRPFLLVGSDALIFTRERVKRYNSAMLLGPDGQVVDRYDKIHLVMFGEYIPLGSMLSFLGSAFNFSGATPGTIPTSMNVNGAVIVPSICFESVLPHFLSWQMRSVGKQSKVPDILVNITNDSWFRGSSILDHHLACAILSSVEHRRPILVAANGGLSAWIDGAGQIQELSPRLEKHLILATPYRDNRWGLFQLIGDTPVWVAASLCVAALAFSYFSSPRSHACTTRSTISIDTSV